MKREDRANDPAPAGDFNRKAIVSCLCRRAGCQNEINRGRKFCSSKCFGISRHKQSRHGPIPVELLDEMQRALDELRAVIQ